MPSACARGAARRRNGSSSITVGLLGSKESVQRSSVRFAPFSIVSNQAPPSSAYLPPSSATPKLIGGTTAALCDGLTVAPATLAPTSAAQHTPIRTLSFIDPLRRAAPASACL